MEILFQEPVTTFRMHPKNGKHKNLQKNKIKNKNKKKECYVFTTWERNCKEKLPLMLLHIRPRIPNGNSLFVGLFHPKRRFHVTSVCDDGKFKLFRKSELRY
jgi:hypothetical protein